MQRRLSTILSLLLLTSFCAGQSLSDYARQQKQQKSGASKGRVVTTDDLSPLPAPAPDPKKTEAKPQSVKTLGYESFTPETWERSIRAQKQWVHFLQEEADKLKTPPPPQFDSKKVATDSKAREYWEERGIQQQYASQIPEQQKKLKELQDQAMKAGMPPSIYDPQ